MRARGPAPLLVLALLAGCSSTTSATISEAPWPAGLTAYVDQARADRVGHDVFVRLVDDTDHRVRVTRAVVTSPRFATATWEGDKTFDHEADLDVELRGGACGEGSDATVELAYRLDDGPEVVSTTTATDRYGALGLLLDRDCAAAALAEAADVEVGEPRVVGRGPRSVLVLPFTLTPTGARDDVVFEGLEDTVLLSQAPGSAAADSGLRVPLGPGDPAASLELRVVPARCDPHALAEDKVGTLFAMRVRGDDVPPEAGAYLPLDDADRAALRGLVPVHCGW